MYINQSVSRNSIEPDLMVVVIGGGGGGSEQAASATISINPPLRIQNGACLPWDTAIIHVYHEIKSSMLYGIKELESQNVTLLGKMPQCTPAMRLEGFTEVDDSCFLTEDAILW